MHVLSKTMRYYDSVAEIAMKNWRRTPREIKREIRTFEIRGRGYSGYLVFF